MTAQLPGPTAARKPCASGDDTTQERTQERTRGDDRARTAPAGRGLADEHHGATLATAHAEGFVDRLRELDGADAVVRASLVREDDPQAVAHRRTAETAPKR